MFGNDAGVLAQTGVEGGLPATGLFAGKFHTDAKAAEDVHHRLAGLRKERIDKAGDKELDCGHKIIFRKENTPNIASGALPNFSRTKFPNPGQ
jgi:hypothetical protein